MLYFPFSSGSNNRIEPKMYIMRYNSAYKYRNFDIRLLLFADELEKNKVIQDSGRINLVKTAKTEIIMHPLVAKQIRDLIDKELEKYDFKE